MYLILGGSFQGKHQFVKKQFPNLKLFDDFEERIWNEYIDNGFDEEHRAKLLNEILKNSVVICNIIGSGIVPLNKNDRVYRDLYGNFVIELQKMAEEVYLVTAGIGQRIK